MEKESSPVSPNIIGRTILNIFLHTLVCLEYLNDETSGMAIIDTWDRESISTLNMLNYHNFILDVFIMNPVLDLLLILC